MELKDLISITSESKSDLNLTTGIHWFLSVDLSSADEIFKLMTLTNSEDLESEVYALAESSSSELKTWISEQVLKLQFFHLTPQLKQTLQIDSVPWVTCIKNSEIIYSKSSIPESLSFIKDLKPEEGKLEEAKVEEVKSEDLKAKEEVLKINEKNNSSKISQMVDKQAEEELDKAMNKIKKLKTRVKEQEQVIEDYRVELRHLKALLEEKSKNEEQAKQKEVKSPIKMENLSWNKAQNFKPKFDEIEFWKVDEKDDYDDGIGFDNNVVVKDLWLMGMLRSSVENGALVKGHVVLPPLNVERSKNSKSTLREEPKFEVRRGKNNKGTFLSSKKIKRGK